jgi:hypothetical protein
MPDRAALDASRELEAAVTSSASRHCGHKQIPAQHLHPFSCLYLHRLVHCSGFTMACSRRAANSSEQRDTERAEQRFTPPCAPRCRAMPTSCAWVHPTLADQVVFYLPPLPLLACGHCRLASSRSRSEKKKQLVTARCLHPAEPQTLRQQGGSVCCVQRHL